MERCEYAPTILGNLTTTLGKDEDDVVVTMYRFFTSEDVCVSYVSVFVFCIIFYVNLLGIGWEFITYFLFSVFRYVMLVVLNLKFLIEPIFFLEQERL